MKKNKQKKKSGGRRPGAGRKLKYGEPAQTISFVVPIRKKTAIKARIEEILPDLVAEADI
jgi:hypothetical protein